MINEETLRLLGIDIPTDRSKYKPIDFAAEINEEVEARAALESPYREWNNGDLIYKMHVVMKQLCQEELPQDFLNFIQMADRWLLKSFINELEAYISGKRVNIVRLLDFVIRCKELKYDFEQKGKNNARCQKSNDKKSLIYKIILQNIHPYFKEIDKLWKDTARENHPGTLSKKRAIDKVWDKNKNKINKIRIEEELLTSKEIDKINLTFKKMKDKTFEARFNKYIRTETIDDLTPEERKITRRPNRKSKK